MLRGSSLRNTDWAIGVVTHTGHDTRIMRNSVRGRQKASSLEGKVSWSIAHIFAIEAFLCSIAATYYTIWNHNNQASTVGYLDLAQDDWNTMLYIKVWLTSLGTWIILFTNMVPISLLVSLELVKYWQALFISWDINLYDTQRDQPTLV